MTKTIDNLFVQIDKIVRFLSALTLGLMTLFISAQVLFRYVLHSPLAWTEELARFLFIWMSFLAAYLAARKSEHIMLDNLPMKLKGIPRKILVSFNNLICVAFFGIVSYYCITLWHKLNIQISPVLMIPISFVYLGMILGTVLMTLWYFYSTFKTLAAKDKAVASDTANLEISGE